VQRSKSTVICDSGKRSVDLSPVLRQGPAIERPTVGDWVVLDASLARIERVLERKSLFKRVGAGGGNEIQPIAANVDTLFIITSCNEEFKESRLERYLALCDEAGAMPVVVLTKTDLCDDTDTYVNRARGVQAGIAVETANALDPASLDGVRAWIDETEDSLAVTSEVREQDKKGRHTTTHRELHQLTSGGLLIDVPGMRELRVAEIDHSIAAVFEDIEQMAMQCQFIDCKHLTEPGCAVLKAVEEKRIDRRRLDNYQKLRRENALATATLAEKRAQGRDFAKMVKQAKLVKNKRDAT
jgi:ribosome biogenesis GTPase